jgi:hypothetical protein
VIISDAVAFGDILDAAEADIPEKPLMNIKRF